MKIFLDLTKSQADRPGTATTNILQTTQQQQQQATTK